MNSRIAGVGGNTNTQVFGCTCALVQQYYGHPNLLIPFFVVNQVTLDLPSVTLPRSRWTHFDNLDLSDPEFHKPQPVDIIFSGDIYNSVLLHQTRPSLRGSPMAHLTSFGWVVSGGYSLSSSTNVQFNPELTEKTVTSCTEADCNSSTSPHKNPRFIDPMNQSFIAPCSQRTNWYGWRQKSRVGSERMVDKLAETHNTRSRFLSSPEMCTVVHLASAGDRTQINDSHAPQYANLLEKMFKIESVAECDPWSPDELLAEELFRKSLSRLPDGRFQISLPFKGDPASLGQSKPIALRRLSSLERRLSKSPERRLAYNKFMRDYLESNHMELAPPLEAGQPHYYLPHHQVHRPDDPPEKIRVVFNASQETMSKRSLNNLLLPGPKLQLDMTEVITRFRQDRWVFISDIRQMFRQIQHPAEDRDFLRILWRFDEAEPIQEYRLCTVTYGTTSAPFLAGRVIREIANIHQTTHPDVADILNFRTYVDDINGGSDEIMTAIRIRKRLQEVLASAQLELRKWAANDPRLLVDLPPDHLLPQTSSFELEDSEESSLKILGLSWQPKSDEFHYRLRPIENIGTKRQLASQIARVYDPLGWLMPLTVYARIIFRTAVQNHHDWDDTLPPSIINDWTRLAQELPDLEALHIPRFVPSYMDEHWLVGFADASERAYGAVLYLVSRSEKNVTVSLITAKARMAPIKAMTLPRLELCAAQLLARTIKKTLPTIKNCPLSQVVALSDSQITLSWITAKHPPLWKVFVGNRVSDILDLLPADHWFHVPTKDNPADHASRGLTPQELLKCKEWWLGPIWLQSPMSEWPVKKVQPLLDNPDVISEARTSMIASNVLSALTYGTDLEKRFSSYSKLERVVGFCLRYIRLLRIRRSNDQRSTLKHQYQNRLLRNRSSNTSTSLQDSNFQPLSVEERESAQQVLVRRAQAQALSAEIVDCQLARPRMKITRSLGLFVDTFGILRVGGRLRNSQIPDQEKHPALLPSHHCLTTLIIENAHKMLLHAGPLSTLHHLRAKFWVVNGKNIVRRQLAKCVRCFTVRPRPFQPEMGQLPADRTTMDSPFLITGVDYAGPFPVSIAGLRGNRILECYLAVFVCFSTKAVHLEVVTDLTTVGFLQAFHRFAARRGSPRTLWSDNGRNFLGAANELKKVRDFLQNPEIQSTVTREAAQQGTTWKFIPPTAPFFGGLWEAAVKQAKRLLKITLRNQVPTLETFSTLITQVEAVLNSRPLTAMSSSPDDLNVLTPAHFLIYRPLALPPSDPTISPRTSLKDRYKFTQHALNTFWQRWKKEYLLEIQSKAQWDSPSRPACIGDLVLVINDNTPPLQWTMGRIIDVHPGTDGITRVADVRTPSGTISRPVRKLCPFPEEVCGAGASTAGEDVSPSLPTNPASDTPSPGLLS